MGLYKYLAAAKGEAPHEILIEADSIAEAQSKLRSRKIVPVRYCGEATVSGGRFSRSTASTPTWDSLRFCMVLHPPVPLAASAFCSASVGRAALSPPPSHAALRQVARALLCKAFPCTSGPRVPRRTPLSACKSYAPTEKNLPVRGKGDESGCRYSGENAIAVRKGLPYHSKAGKPRAPAA